MTGISGPLVKGFSSLAITVLFPHLHKDDEGAGVAGVGCALVEGFGTFSVSVLLTHVGQVD
ncbi:hypothetical protein ACFVZZ_05855 [Streptomyces chartreusis]|uniref:hypothetical protein n=1 Tax=Streptomyces chartreusis TaxID=1969 RepID=UPI0036DBC8ED